MAKKKFTENPHQLTLLDDSLSALTCPEASFETYKEQLKRSTALSTVSIVSEGFDKPHSWINWPHYENMWKLFALENVFILGKPTPQQEKDRQDLRCAIYIAGNAKYKRKRLTVEEIIERDSKEYMTYGKNIIRAKAEKDSYTSERRLKSLRSDIYDTRSEENATQLRRVTHKVKAIYDQMMERYNTR